MTADSLRRQLEIHRGLRPGQAATCAAFLALLDDAAGDPFVRERLDGHFTGSAWLVSGDGRRVLLEDGAEHRGNADQRQECNRKAHGRQQLHRTAHGL